jgi:tetraacyldisaccharide 4'-kinase
MTIRAPAFWNKSGALATMLSPASWLWTMAGRVRAQTTTPTRVPVPIICVGNLTAGGAGKTPTALALLRILGERSGGRPIAHALTRGYGGSLEGPVRVDPTRHTASEVGDEALLLARAAPTWVARDRVAGALAAAAAGARMIVMDDGFQNPTLAKDLSLVVVDGKTGFGNRRVMPAGPLREPIARGLARAHAVIVVGDDEVGITADVHALRHELPVLAARLTPDADAVAAVKNHRMLAFAGIGRPEKFFTTLLNCGAHLVAERAYADHHRFSAEEIAALEAEASRFNARLITTEKDHVRLDPAAQSRIATLPVTLTFDDEATFARLLDSALASPVRATP